MKFSIYLKSLIVKELLEHGQSKSRLELGHHVAGTVDGDELELVEGHSIASFVQSVFCIRLS